VSARIVGATEATALRVETAYDTGTEQRDVMAEAPQEAGLAAPTMEAASPPGRAAYVFPLAPDGVPFVKEKPLTFTLVSDRGSCETTSRVE
jgi:hypothetical protein